MIKEEDSVGFKKKDDIDSDHTGDYKLRLGKVCPHSLNINQINDHMPYPDLLEFDEIYSILNYWHEFNCPLQNTCTFISIGQHLLHHAIEKKKTLLTLQVGAMDGKSNDPMYEMFVKPDQKEPTFVSNRDSFVDLQNWLPVMIEPLPSNFQTLQENYADIAKTKGLGCAVPINAIASYNTSTTTCPFCRANTSRDAPLRCKNFPSWKRFQLGTLECNNLLKFLGKKDFDLCIIQDPLPCSSALNLLSEKSVPTKNIAMLQIDIEGYEYAFFGGFLKEMEDTHLPPIIHFEHKVMKSPQLATLEKLLKSKGYVLYKENNEDTFALRLHQSSEKTSSY